MSGQILLIDDDPKFRRIAVLAANEYGFSTCQAATLRDAEMELQCGKFDLIVVDGQLPDGDGLSFVSKQRRLGNKSKVLFISAHMKDSTSFNTLTADLQVEMVLPKPVSLKVLSEEFRKVLVPDEDIEGQDNNSELKTSALEYERELPVRLEELSNCMIELMSEPKSTELQAESIRMAHNLKGSAGSFGFDELGDTMGQVEALLLCFQQQLRIFPDRFALRKLVAAKGLVSFAFEEIASTLPPAKSISANRKHIPCVLLLDRDNDFIHRAESLLSSDGILVYAFKDTIHALDVAYNLQPDVIMIGSEIFEHEGQSFSQELIRQPWFSRKTSILVFGSSERLNVPRDSRTGVKRFANKSMTNIQLLDLLHHYIRTDCEPLHHNRGALVTQ